MATVTQELHGSTGPVAMMPFGTQTYPDQLTAPPFASAATMTGVAGLYYSNNPESVTATDLADPTMGAAWLNRQGVETGAQIFLWHANSAGQTINAALQASATASVTVTVHQAGAVGTSGTTVTDGKGNSLTAHADNVGAWND